MPEPGTTGPDLSSGREAVEALMDERCTIRLDEEGSDDNTFDEADLTEVPPDVDELYLYQGACYVKSGSGSDSNRGERTEPSSATFVALPLSAPEIPVGAVVEITASRRDPQLVCAKFSVKETITKTFAVSRKLRVERIYEP